MPRYGGLHSEMIRTYARYQDQRDQQDEQQDELFRIRLGTTFFPFSRGKAVNPLLGVNQYQPL